MYIFSAALLDELNKLEKQLKSTFLQTQLQYSQVYININIYILILDIEFMGTVLSFPPPLLEISIFPFETIEHKSKYCFQLKIVLSYGL